MRCRPLLSVTFAVVLIASSAAAQPAASDPPAAGEESPGDHAEPAQAAQDNVGRACDGCPPRRVLTSLLQATYINVFYELANLIRGQDTAKITPKTWWINMKRGWEWDLDDFAVNQIGHPYQGNNYFNAGRANGLDFWESAALTAFGSGTWEYFGETNQASLNDFINTTLGGIALGEMFHRTAWLVRNPSTTSGRLKREIFATAIDPITGVNRFLSGDSSRVTEKPPDMVPSKLGVVAAIGFIARGSNTEDIDPGEHLFVETDLVYGDLQTGRSRTPYDAFNVRLDFGGGSAFSEARVRGRLLGQPFRNGAMQLSVAQGYQYNNNDAYQFGAQSADVSLGFTWQLTPRTSLWAVGWGGATILGAVDSLPPPGYTGGLPSEPADDAGQGVSTGPRNYDYGPGANAGGLLYFARNGREFVTLSYELHHLHVLDGIRANHLLQRGRADLHFPIKGRFGVGVTGEFFDRRTYYQLPGFDSTHFYFPQFRAFMTWSQS